MEDASLAANDPAKFLFFSITNSPPSPPLNNIPLYKYTPPSIRAHSWILGLHDGCIWKKLSLENFIEKGVLIMQKAPRLLC